MFKKFLRTRVRNTDGFTMIEALIIAALLGVMVTTFASYQYQRAKQAKARETKNEYNQLQTNVKTSIGQSESLSHAEEVQFDENAPAPTPDDSTPTPTPSPAASPQMCPAVCTYHEDSSSCTVNASACPGGNCPEGCTVDLTH